MSAPPAPPTRRATLRVLAAGAGCSIQDRGRFGHLRSGLTSSGPMDPLAHEIALRALGRNPPDPVVEISLAGLEVAAEAFPIGVAYAGGRFRVRLGGIPLPPAAVLRLEPGQRLSFSAGEAGAWCYLAMDGRADLPEVLGSRATFARAGIGGLGGRMLRAGDGIPVEGPPAQAPRAGPDRLAHPLLDALSRDGPVRIVPGPQDDHFDAAAMERFLARDWAVTARSDRMGMQLAGGRIEHNHRGYNIVSDGAVFGSIQVPGSGEPIVLMADRQPTGGYPKIATVIRADIGRLAQRRPGDRVRFVPVTVEAAVAAWRERIEALSVPAAREPLVRTDLSSEFLLGLNLIDGVVAG